jgi:hypothetical protein
MGINPTGQCDMEKFLFMLLGAAAVLMLSSCAVPGKTPPEPESVGERTGIGLQAGQAGGDARTEKTGDREQAGRFGGIVPAGETEGSLQTKPSAGSARHAGQRTDEGNGTRTDEPGGGARPDGAGPPAPSSETGGEAKPDGEEPLAPIAEIPERNIALYGASDGVLLGIGKHEQALRWAYMTPRGIPPALHLADFDADGAEELAVTLYIGSGTGVVS